jgi:hypothetical protein
VVMEPPPGAQKRPGPRGKGPEVQELFRATSKQPAGMCGAPALEAPPWTPLCANYVVVQVWGGTRQVDAALGWTPEPPGSTHEPGAA